MTDERESKAAPAGTGDGLGKTSNQLNPTPRGATGQAELALRENPRLAALSTVRRMPHRGWAR